MDIPVPRQARRLSGRRAAGGVLVLAAAGGLVAVVLGLKPVVPTIAVQAAWSDTVRSGAMVVRVRGPGTMTPERTRFVAALTAGRVERRLVQVGAQVHAGTVLLEMTNPDVELDALEARRELSAAESALETLRAQRETARLDQEAALETLARELAEARRLAAGQSAVAAAGGVARTALDNAQDRVHELERRLTIEHRRLDVIANSSAAQLRSQADQVVRSRAVADFQRARLASLRVRAASAGVVQDLPVEEGQWVTPGTTLARVVQPERLKAVLRIAEVQAADVLVGQAAVVDLRTDTLVGRVARMDPAAQGGVVLVDVVFDDGHLPRSARPDLSVEGVIEIARVDGTLFIGRPPAVQPHTTARVWRLDGRGYADRVPVRFGRGSADVIEVLGGLAAGDALILADLSSLGDADRVRLR